MTQKKVESAIGFVIVDNSINLFLDGQSYTISPDHLNHKLVLKELRGKRRPYLLRKYVSVKKTIENFLKGRVRVDVDRGEVLYKGVKVEPVIEKKIVEFVQKGLNAKPLILFLDKLMGNPSARAVNELYKFLENNGLCLNKKGNILSYKSVRPNWYDHYSGKFLNKPGKTISIPRNQVDDDARNTCSRGVHCGTFQYAKGFHSGNQRVILVEVSPSDVVSIPIDGSNKCRVCKYKVIKEYLKEEPIKDALYLG